MALEAEARPGRCRVLGVQGLGFQVWGLGFRVQGSEFRVRGLRFKVWGLGVWV